MNHTCLVGFLVQDMGALGTPLMYAFREREKILDLFESLSGSRMMCNYMRFGGCRVDLPAGWLEQAKQVVANYPQFLDEFEALLTGNEILMARTQGVGVLPRGTGGQCQHHRTDVARQRASITIFAKWTNTGSTTGFDFRVPLGDHGDVLRPLHDPRAGDARVAEDFGAGAARHSRRADRRSQGEVARFSSQGRARLTGASKGRKASWDFISSAMVRPIRIVIASARRA